MKMSPSVRMTLAHRLARRDMWMLGTKYGARRGINTYKDLFSIALKQVNVEVGNIEAEMIDLHERSMDKAYDIKQELRDALYSVYDRERRLATVRTRQKQLAEMTKRFNALRAFYVEIYREITEEDKQRLRDALPEGERLDHFGFGISNLRRDGRPLLAILAVIAEQWVYVKPCCNCGSRYGCDCGCECEHYGETCDCGDDSDW